MTDPAHAPEEKPFSAADWEEFQRQDGVAGRMVGGLMIVIFSIGVFIYSIVLWSTMT
jgi:hypothetical protein